ncbi:hypothetical protein Tsubulata_015546 [Turnera subulata]|uniref:Wax synthase domain-containing protein n=1 Tax=Turnera subulata TaxID=218843 RepID=A0A9Q0JHU7_9ROSI|nr:hypothetical protein Tsubulata_015546 [Turnera subulata]
MDGELKNFIKVWTLAITCLCYCYYIASRIPKGMLRLLSLLPVLFLFLTLPFDLTSVHLGGVTAFFLIWLGTFKLLLFSFDQGPLSPPPPNLFLFISIACLPIKLTSQDANNPSHQKINNTKPHPAVKPSSNILMPRSLLLMSIKVMLLAMILYSYNYRQHMHPYLLLSLLCLHMYIELEFVLAICATPASILLGFDLEPQFNEPYLSTSLQDFWGRRWNLMVTSILRPTVYIPVRQSCAPFIGSTLASLPAIIITFVVSGLMHELLYYHLTRATPTWEVTWFFVLHGFCTAVELAVKKAVADRWLLPPVVSGPLTAGFVVVTAFWLFCPQIIRNGVHEKIIGEIFSVLRIYVKR